MRIQQADYIWLDGAMSTPKRRTHRTLPKANRLAVALLTLLLVLQGSMYSLHAQTAMAFDRRYDFGVGSSPQTVVIADFNRDGAADLATANRDSYNVTVLLGSADASGGHSTDGGGADINFELAGHFAVGGSPSALTSGDFNGDGAVDLAASIRTSLTVLLTVSVLIGNGDGTFQTAVNVAVGGNPTSITAGDLNRDGRLDIVTASPEDEMLSLLLGRGDGTFKEAVNIQVAAMPTSVVVGDFNDDGAPDVATANSRSGASSVSILFGRGDGTFEAEQGYGVVTGTSSAQLAVGDFDRDGIEDLAAVSEELPPELLRLNIDALQGSRDGKLRNVRTIVEGVNPSSATAGDFNNDGILDLAITNTDVVSIFTTDTVLVLVGGGDGSFEAGLQAGVGALPRGIANGDLDRDGKLDVAVANSGSESVTVLLNTTP